MAMLQSIYLRQPYRLVFTVRVPHLHRTRHIEWGLYYAERDEFQPVLEIPLRARTAAGARHESNRIWRRRPRRWRGRPIGGCWVVDPIGLIIVAYSPARDLVRSPTGEED